MKQILLLAFLLLFITSCDDDVEDRYHDYITGDATPKGMGKGGASVNGLYFNLDSVCNYVVVKYNERSINELAQKMIESLAKRDKIFEYENPMDKKYGFHLSQKIMDSLAYYNYTSADIGTSGEGKEITLYGSSPYKEKNIWDNVIVNVSDLPTKHPRLYQKALSRYTNAFHPHLLDVVVEDQGGNFIAYNAKVEFSNGNEQYVRFVVANKNEKLVIAITGQDEGK